MFGELVEQAAVAAPQILSNAQWVATIDVLRSFATTAEAHDYVRPTFRSDRQLAIDRGRHAVIEQVLPEGTPYICKFLGNGQCYSIHCHDHRSQYEWSECLVASNRPHSNPRPSGCVRAGGLRRLCPVMDRLFVRVGASDNLSKGESTFMVEMNETATILNNISDRSLVILEEIGRGTSTFDGVSIAWGIAEYLHQHPSIPLVLFATHYHELNEMEKTFGKVRNYHISTEEHKGSIIFTRQLKPGGTAHSFGLHVAKLAGIPGYVLHRAGQVLGDLEAQRERGETPSGTSAGAQLNFFSMDRPELEDICGRA